MAVAVLPMAAEFGWPPAVVGLVQSAFLWGYTATQLLGGALADKHGGRAVLAAGIAAFSVAQAITPLALSPAVATAGFALPALLAARAAVGAGEGVALPSMSALVAAHVPSKARATALGASFAGFHCGNLLGLALSPLLLAAVGWRGLFAVFGVVGGPLLAAWLALVPRRAGGVQPTTPTPTPPPSPATLLSHPATWAIIAANVANHWGYFVYLTWLPSFFARSYGASAASASALTFGPWVAMAAGSAAAGVLADAAVSRGAPVRSVRVVVQTVAFLVPAAVLALIALRGPSLPPTLASALFAAALGASSLGQAGFVANMGDVAPSGAGAMFGLCNTFGASAGIAGVAAAGAIVQATGSFAPLFWTTAGLYVVGAAVFAVWCSGERVV